MKFFISRKKQTHNLRQVWKSCGRWPTIVTTDDEQQLRPWSDDHSPVLVYLSTILLKTAKMFFLHKPFRADCACRFGPTGHKRRWDRMTQSCVFEEGTVGISTIRILFRHEANNY